MATSITLRALSKHFGPVAAVDGVSLDVPPGSLFFLLGPSGCGKTTVLRVIAGFTEPTAGTVHFGDRDVTGLPANRRNTGMVFQSYALWPHMTVRQNVAFGLGVRRVPAAEQTRRVDQALALVQMREYHRRKPNELSGGQQQRVALARALVVEPDVLLLDEPLSNLDAKLRLEMRGQIRQICRAAGITAVYVTHDQKEALSMADHMAVLRAGRVEQVGPPRQLYDRPANRFVADFLGETNFIPATVRGTDGPDLVLDCPAGALRSRVFPPGLAAGESVTCCVRPEAVHLAAAASSGAAVNDFAGQAVDCTYLGEMAQHRLRIHEGLVLKAFELNPRPAAPGQEPRVWFEADDVVVLRQ